MDFNSKKYKIIKTKKYFKNNNLFFFFNSTKLKSSEWLLIEQELKKLKLKYYRILNGTALKTVGNSIFKNYSSLISGVVILIKPRLKSTLFNLNNLQKELKSLFSLVSVKLNNKIYSIKQLENFNQFSYKQNMFSFYQTLERYSKITYTISK